MRIRKVLFLVFTSLLVGFMISKPVLSMTEEEKWTQFKDAGITLQFITEDTPANGAIISLLPEFEERTGIKVEVTRANVSDVVTKLMLDLGSGTSGFDILYSPRWQVLPAFSDVLVDVRKFQEDPDLPHLPMDEFFESHLIATSFYVDKERQIGVPHDTSTMTWFYRKDIFDKYRDQFMAEKGYDWTPGPNITWDQYLEIAQWINENVSEVNYGAGHMAKQWNSIYCDFSNVFWAFGARGFENPETESYGVIFPGRCLWDSPEAIEAAKFYKKLITEVAHPASVGWDWASLGEAFSKGDEIAMCFNWQDYMMTFDDPIRSKVAGKVEAALMPKGKDGRSHNYYSGTGLTISGYLPEERQKAAWLFVVWQADIPVQKEIFKMGSTPVRKSAYEDPEVKQWIEEGTYPGAKIAPVMLKAWEPENIEFVEAKIPMFVETMIIQYTHLSYMVEGKETPEEAMKKIVEEVNKATGYTKLIEEQSRQ